MRRYVLCERTHPWFVSDSITSMWICVTTIENASKASNVLRQPRPSDNPTNFVTGALFSASTIFKRRATFAAACATYPPFILHQRPSSGSSRRHPIICNCIGVWKALTKGSCTVTSRTRFLREIQGRKTDPYLSCHSLNVQVPPNLLGLHIVLTESPQLVHFFSI